MTDCRERPVDEGKVPDNSERRGPPSCFYTRPTRHVGNTSPCVPTLRPSRFQVGSRPAGFGHHGRRSQIHITQENVENSSAMRSCGSGSGSINGSGRGNATTIVTTTAASTTTATATYVTTSTETDDDGASRPLRSSAALLALSASADARPCKCANHPVKRPLGSDGVRSNACSCARYLNLCSVGLRPPEVGAAVSLLDTHGFTELGFSGNPALGESSESLTQVFTGTCIGLFASRCSIGPQGGEAIARALSQEPPGALCLKRLGLNSNRLGEQAALSLANACGYGHLASLQVLGLSANGLGDDAAIGLASAIREPCAIRRLFLNENRIGCRGAAAFGDGLAAGRFVTLGRLGLANNQIDEVCQLISNQSPVRPLRVRSSRHGRHGGAWVNHCRPRTGGRDVAGGWRHRGVDDPRARLPLWQPVPLRRRRLRLS